MTSTCENFQSQISGYLDGELTQQDSQRVRLHVEKCDSCRSMVDDLKSMQQQMSQMEMPTLSERQLHQLINDRTARGLEWIGWMLFVGGLSILVGFFVYQFLQDGSMPFWLKLTISSLVAGGGFLFGSVVRERMIASKTDRYNKVDL